MAAGEISTGKRVFAIALWAFVFFALGGAFFALTGPRGSGGPSGGPGAELNGGPNGRPNGRPSAGPGASEDHAGADAGQSDAAARREPPTAAEPVGGATGSAPSSASETTAPVTIPGAARPPEAPPVAATGRLAPEVIRDTVREAMPYLRFCFEWQLDRHPELAGRVTMSWTIDETGHATDADVLDDALGDETVLRCFRGVVGRLEFPVPEGGPVSVHYPFVLSGAPEARRPEGI